MSQEPTLQSHLRAQFQLAFGAPHRTVGHDDQWQLDCQGAIALNILVTGGATHPTVWVFSAHDPETGVFGKAIATRDEVPEIIRHIQKRLDLPLPVEETKSTGYAVSA
jgi:hypothetical protein